MLEGDDCMQDGNECTLDGKEAARRESGRRQLPANDFPKEYKIAFDQRFMGRSAGIGALV